MEQSLWYDLMYETEAASGKGLFYHVKRGDTLVSSYPVMDKNRKNQYVMERQGNNCFRTPQKNNPSS